VSHTPFIVAAYAVFFVVLVYDLMAPALAKRRLLQRLRARAARESARGRT